MPEQQTDVLAKGSATSEGKLAILGAVTGVLVALAGGVAPLFLQAAQERPNVFWLQALALLAGPGLVALTSSAYARSRALVKGGILDLLRDSAASVGPVVVAALLRKYAPTVSVPPLAAEKVAATGAIRG